MQIAQRGRPTVLVAGGGAAGLLTTLHLARAADRDVDVVVIDPASLGGVAFSTTDDDHLLNVPAFGMSALPDDPGHFAAWRARDTGRAVDPHEFVPRSAWRRYLTATLADAIAATDDRVGLHHVRRRAVRVDRRGAAISLGLDDGTTVLGDAFVIATGLPAAATAWAPETLRHSASFVADPWAPGALETIRDDTEKPHPGVLLVGTGLTMVDVAVSITTRSRPDRFVHAVSRSGLLPRRHRDGLLTPVVPDVEDWGSDLRSILPHVRALFADSEAATGDWRPAADGLRHRLQELWGRLDEHDRVAFLADHAGHWNRLRHRIPGPSARRIDGLRAAGVLTISAGQVVATTELDDGGVRVDLSDGTRRDVGWVVNCTGPREHVAELGNPLLDDLLRPRPGGSLAVCATAGMGFRTHAGRLVGTAGHPDAPIWILGALRRGELWESTAVPEIRVQARDVAEAVAACATAQPVTITRTGTLPEGRPR